MQPLVTELIALATLAVLNGFSSTANDNKEIEIVQDSLLATLEILIATRTYIISSLYRQNLTSLTGVKDICEHKKIHMPIIVI